VGGCGGVCVGNAEVRDLKTHAVLAGLLYGTAVYFFMNYLVLPLSAVAASTFHLGLFLNGVIGHALFVGLPISLFAPRVQ
jgi:hypothetical protein